MLLEKSHWKGLYIPTGSYQLIRMLKPQEILHHMNEVDTDVFALNLLDKYVNYP